MLFQAKAGREKEFRLALQKLRGKDADITNEAEGIQVSIQALEILPQARIQDLVSKKHARSVIVSVTQKPKHKNLSIFCVYLIHSTQIFQKIKCIISHL